jgi:hypothetical protein
VHTKIKLLSLLFVFGAVFFGLTACGAEDRGAGPKLELAPVSVLPDRIRQAPPTVQEAYRFAVANQELVSQFPCYCGCVDAGHKSNLDCYIQEVQPDGSIIFDEHAFG